MTRRAIKGHMLRSKFAFSTIRIQNFIVVPANRALGGAHEEPVRLVRAEAILVLPPAIASEDHNAFRRILHHLAHIEGENILSQVFSRPKVTRPERLARLATTFRPMHDHEAI